MSEQEILDFLVLKLKERREIKRIVLFGSRARGTANPRSDFDLCVIIDDVPDKRMAYVEFMRDIASPDWSVDLMLLTDREFDAKLKEGWSIMLAVEREGKMLYAA